jgi:UDP-GlcNAc:undecaprenyl-phosphate GlcNAc-1-phosphate transferase
MRFIYFVFFALSFFISFVATFLVARVAIRRKIVDVPDSERHFHKQATPTLGGFAIFGSFFLVTLFIGVFGGYLMNGNIPFQILLGIWAGGAVLMIGGYLDDRYRLPASTTIIFPTIAAVILVTSGLRAVSVHSPFDGHVILLDQIRLWGLPL